MVVSIIVTVVGLGVACMGMKCTTCGGDDKVRKSRIAMTGGIITLIGCKKPFNLVFYFPFCISCVYIYIYLAYTLYLTVPLLLLSPQRCVPLSPALGMLMTSSRPSTTLSPLLTQSK